MIHVTIDDLRNLIALKANETVVEYRLSKGAEHDPFSMAYSHEIDEFIRTIPYYDNHLKRFLLGEHYTCSVFVSEIWFGKFYSAITWWYDSEEWMDYPPEMLEDALLKYETESISKLCMPYLNLDERLTKLI